LLAMPPTSSYSTSHSFRDSTRPAGFCARLYSRGGCLQLDSKLASASIGSLHVLGSKLAAQP
jgi:hypothetical protein